jgi:hypothetical protein
MGLYGNGMHDFILDEAVLGTRVAMAQDSEDAEGGAYGAYLMLTMPGPCERWPTCDDVLGEQTCTWPSCMENK